MVARRMRWLVRFRGRLEQMMIDDWWLMHIDDWRNHQLSVGEWPLNSFSMWNGEMGVNERLLVRTSDFGLSISGAADRFLGMTLCSNYWRLAWGKCAVHTSICSLEMHQKFNAKLATQQSHFDVVLFAASGTAPFYNFQAMQTYAAQRMPSLMCLASPLHWPRLMRKKSKDVWCLGEQSVIIIQHLLTLHSVSGRPQHDFWYRVLESSDGQGQIYWVDLASLSRTPGLVLDFLFTSAISQKRWDDQNEVTNILTCPSVSKHISAGAQQFRLYPNDARFVACIHGRVAEIPTFVG